jgi:hypothetical protein
MPIDRNFVDTSPIRLSLPAPKRRRGFTAAELAQISREVREQCPAPSDPPADTMPWQATGQPGAPALECVARNGPGEVGPEGRDNAAAATPSMSAKSARSPDRPASLRGAGSAATELHLVQRQGFREACKWFELWRICRKARCRKAGRCRGEAAACLRAGLALAPDSAREFVRRMMQARDLGLSFDEAFEGAAHCHDGYFAWLDGLRAADL